jgi:hypothetical protein
VRDGTGVRRYIRVRNRTRDRGILLCYIWNEHRNNIELDKDKRHVYQSKLAQSKLMRLYLLKTSLVSLLCFKMQK